MKNNDKLYWGEVQCERCGYECFRMNLNLKDDVCLKGRCGGKLKILKLEDIS